MIPDASPSEKTISGQELACMVCAKTTVESGRKTEIEHCLAWDMPRINFHLNQRSYYRRYTRFFGRDGKAAPEMARYAFGHYWQWERDIHTWHQPILLDM